MSKGCKSELIQELKVRLEMKTFLVERQNKTLMSEVKYIWHIRGFPKWFMRHTNVCMQEGWFLKARKQI